jgi:biotin synthase
MRTIDPETLTSSDIRDILNLRGNEQEELFRQAREVRQCTLGEEVTIRGVLEISNHCGKDCKYCAMRRSNRNLSRYRMSEDQVMEIARQVADYGIGCFFLQSAQDPQIDAMIEDIIPRVKQELGLSVLLCLGEKSKAQYERFAAAGADSYILKFETSNEDLYGELGCGSYASRQACSEHIREAGMKLGSGNIIGLPGQDFETLVADIELGMRIRPDFVSAAPFIPNNGTPCENAPLGDAELTLNTMALWRIALGGALIPAVSALQKVDPDGQFRGLRAGANVITINFTPPDFRNRYCIYAQDRFIVSLDHAVNIVKRAGLRPVLELAESAGGR